MKFPIWIPRPIRKQFKARKYQKDRSLASNWLLLWHAQHSPSSLQRLLVHRLQPLLWFVLIQPKQRFRKLLQNLHHRDSNMAIQMKTMNCQKEGHFQLHFPTWESPNVQRCALGKATHLLSCQCSSRGITNTLLSDLEIHEHGGYNTRQSARSHSMWDPPPLNSKASTQLLQTLKLKFPCLAH